MRARVTIYDNTIASLAHLMAVGDLCRRAVNARTVDAYIDRIDGETVVTVTPATTWGAATTGHPSASPSPPTLTPSAGRAPSPTVSAPSGKPSLSR